MKPKILLRIAAVLMLLHTIGHTFGTLSWKKTNDSVKQEVIKQMTSNKFPFMGATRSMGDAMDGYGFFGIVNLLLVTVILWIASNYISQHVALVNQILIALSIAL
jgi:hypothetical protein